MADDKKTETGIIEEFGPVKENEALLTKVMRAGLISVISSTYGKRIVKNKAARYLGVAGLSLMLSNDEDTVEDLTALGIIGGIGLSPNLIKHAINGNEELTRKAFMMANNMDKFVNATNLRYNLTKDVQKEIVVGAFKQNFYSDGKLENLDTFGQMASTALKSVKDSAVNLYKNIKENGYGNMYKQHKEYQIYVNEYKGKIDPRMLETIVNDNIRDIGITQKIKDKDGFIASLSDNAPFTQEINRKIKKIHKIETNTFFADIMGLYSRYDESTGKVVYRVDKLLKSSEANFVKPLSVLAENFIAESTNNSLNNSRFYQLNAEEKEAEFVNYLYKNGLDEIVEKAYKKDNLISIGEINNKYFNNVTQKDLELIDKDLYFSITNKVGKGMEFLNIKNVKNGDETIKKIQGIKHNDILKNFAFTNIVEKNGVLGIKDNTTLDNYITSMKFLGVVEFNVVGAFQNAILSKTGINIWKPLELFQTNERIKEKVANDMLGFYYNQNGFLINKMRIATEKMSDFSYVGGEPIETVKSINYIKDEYRNTYVSFKKTILDVATESYSVSNFAKKYPKTYSELANKYKENGNINEVIQEFTNSFINPFGIRYDKDNKKYRFISSDDGYFKESNIVDLFLNRKVIKNAGPGKGIWSKLNPNNIAHKIYDKIEEKNKHVSKVFDILLGGTEDLDAERLKKFNASIDTAYTVALRDITNAVASNSLNSDNFRNITMKEIMRTLLASNAKLNELTDESDINAYKKVIQTVTETFNDVDKGFTINDMAKINKKITEEYNNMSGPSQKAMEFNYQMINALYGLFTDKKNPSNGVLKRFADFVGKQDIKTGSNELDELITVTQNRLIQDIINGKQTELFQAIKTGASRNADLKATLEEISSYGHARKLVSYDIKNLFSNDYILRNDSIEQFAGADSKDNFMTPIVEMIKAKRYIDTMDPSNYRPGKETILTKIDSATGNRELKVDVDIKKLFDNLKQDVRSVEPEIKLEELRRMSIVELSKKRRDLLYTKNSEVSSSILLQRSFENAYNVENILKRARLVIQNLIRPQSMDVAEEKGIIRSKNFNRLDSSFNIASKMVISKLQDSLEIIGIERIPNHILEDGKRSRVLGEYGHQQLFNFMKYRMVPLAGIVMGAKMIDSASDAIVPDEIPIFGNGISGVAANTYAASRVALQYGLKATGLLAIGRAIQSAVPIIDNGLTSPLDLLMDPSEMIDVYFKGKPIEVKDNRFWFTAGRQSGEGEEFRQYRPHMLYMTAHKSSGIYSGKIEKFFRKDFLPTKYPWYLLDPYKEERDAYNKYGALFPKSEQLFVDVPIIGHLLSNTLGEIIKPTKYFNESEWRVGKNLMKNPNYIPGGDESQKYIEFTEPNKISQTVFEAFEDLKTWSGLQGYLITKSSELLFGKSNPYQNKNMLDSIDRYTNLFAQYDKLQIGGMFGTTEGIRRLIDSGDALGMNAINPLTQELPEWMPEYYKRGNNPYLTLDYGEYILDGDAFDKTESNIKSNEDLTMFRQLSMLSPMSKEYQELAEKLQPTVSEMSRKEKKHYFESLAFASEYGKRDFEDNDKRAGKIKQIKLTIDKKISPYEFISDGKRYKLDAAENDFNELTRKLGSNTATFEINKLNGLFEEGSSHIFDMSEDATYSAGIDGQGDFFKVDSDEISRKVKTDSAYNYKGFGKLLSLPLLAVANRYARLMYGPGNMSDEKKYGANRSAYQEWSYENVQSPFFRDWDSPVTSFLLPYHTMASNSLASYFLLANDVNNAYYKSDSSTNVAGMALFSGLMKLPFNKLTGNVSTSNEYKEDTKIKDEIEKIKHANQKQSYYSLTGQENLFKLKEILNDQDKPYFEELANTQNKSEREKILATGNDRLNFALTSIWNRQQQAITGTSHYEYTKKPYESSEFNFKYHNDNTANLILKQQMGHSFDRLDKYTLGRIQAYRGTVPETESKFIMDRLKGLYNGGESNVSSTIYSHGTINLNRNDRR